MVGFRRIVVALATALICQAAPAETVLLDFTTPGCGPCRLMRPIIERLAADGFKVREVDALREPAVVSQFQVDRFPTFIVLVDGAERARLVGGGVPQAQLVQMIRKAEEIAASARAKKNGTPLSFVEHTEPTVVGPVGSLQGIQREPERVVPIAATPAISRAGVQGPSSPRADVAARSATTDHLIAATVRISVQDSDGRSTGSGSIVDAREGKALVLTCGHLFRASNGKGPIEVSLFTGGANGAELHGTVEGTLIHYDLERDLALVCFVPQTPVQVTPIAPAGTQTTPGTTVSSVGCEHGANPTPWACRITAVNRFMGYPNIEAAPAPVEGRSGGGLFNEAGQLIGVCYAADPQGNEGLYASVASIQEKLDSLNLSAVYKAPSLGNGGGSTGGATNNQLAAANSPIEVRGQSPTTTDPLAMLTATTVPTQPATSSVAQTPSPAATSAADAVPLTAEEQATLQEIGRRATDAEIICIIRPRSPGGRSEVLKLDRASAAMVRALQAATQQDSSAAVETAPAATNTAVR